MNLCQRVMLIINERVVQHGKITSVTFSNEFLTFFNFIFKESYARLSMLRASQLLAEEVEKEVLCVKYEA